MLICDTSGMIQAAPGACILTTSPLKCLKSAYEHDFDLIAIAIGSNKIREREALIELCLVLKESLKKKSTKLLVLLPAKHRAQLERIREAGVDYVTFIGRQTLSPEKLEKIALHLNDTNRPSKVLQEACPYIHYKKIDSRRELAVCTADHDRLVLGPTLLQRLCEVPEHENCQYFKAPKLTDKKLTHQSKTIALVGPTIKTFVR